jgi:cell division protein FtsQ
LSDVAGRRAAIDPRIRARRIAVQRDEGRKRLRRVAIAAGAVAVLAALWGLTRTPLLDVDHVEVAGATHSGVETVIATSTIERGGALVTAPLGRAADRIAALPWVETVEVTRRWPGTVVIEVVERRPVAYVPATKGVVLVDRAGRQLAAAEAPPPELLRLDVAPIAPTPGASLPTRTRAVLDLAGTVPTSLAGRIVALRTERDGTVSGTVRLRNNTDAHLLLGAPTQTGAKWLALATVLDGADPARLATIDLRVPAAPALTRR